MTATNTPAPSRPTTPLAARLESLFHPSTSMRPKVPIASSASTPAPSRPSSLRSLQMQPKHTPSSSTSSPRPILRWLQPIPPSTSSSASSTPPSPSLEALQEALSHDLLPSLPQQARLPSSFYTSHALSRPPPFLDNLTRSTLPTASVSAPVAQVHPQTILPQAPPIVRPHSPHSGNSLDSLRALRDRGIHTSAVASQEQPQPSSSNPAITPSWWWFQSENKENVDTLLNEEDRADSIKEEHENIRRKYRTPKNPIVFCHGLLGFDSVTIGPAIAPLQVSHWRGIKEVLEANGCEVLITRVPATSSPVDRAKVLEQKVSSVYPGRSVHLIGHSMGGLDCRYLTTHLTHRTFRVLTVTTIATPHRGSSFADHFLTAIGPSRMPSVLQLLDLLPNGGGDGTAFQCLTVEAMKVFNADTPDVPGVKYFSWGAVYDPGLIDTWKYPHSVILEKEGPNDGLVSVESSKWGTYLGTLSHVNHLDLVGWVNTARYKWAEMMGKGIKFRPATFYLGIADYLAGVEDDDETEGSSSQLGSHNEVAVEDDDGVGERGRLSGDEFGTPGRGKDSGHERSTSLDSVSAHEEEQRARMADSLGKGEKADTCDLRSGANSSRSRKPS